MSICWSLLGKKKAKAAFEFSVEAELIESVCVWTYMARDVAILNDIIRCLSAASDMHEGNQIILNTECEYKKALYVQN